MDDTSSLCRRTSREATNATRMTTGIVAASVLGSLAVFCAIVVPAIDRGAVQAINVMATRSVFFDTLVAQIDQTSLFVGTPLVLILWYIWFSRNDRRVRATIISGVLAAVPASAVSRYLQHALNLHPRPYYDTSLGFVHPVSLAATQYNTWGSFPSDHATLFGALAATIWLVKPKVGLVSAAIFLMLEMSRVYMGAHCPSDLLAGSALGLFAACVAQNALPLSVADRAVGYSVSSPQIFYPVAYLLTSRVALIFGEIRNASHALVNTLSFLH